MVLAELDRRQRERLRRIERILGSYERDRERLEGKIMRLRQERHTLSGSGFPLMTLATSLLGNGGGALAKAASGLVQGNNGKWTSQVFKFERELRNIQQKSEEISGFVRDVQNTLDLVLSGVGLITGSGGGKLLDGILGSGSEGEGEGSGAQVVFGEDGEGGASEVLQGGELKLPNLSNLNMGALMEIANSPQFKALSREILQKLGK